MAWNEMDDVLYGVMLRSVDLLGAKVLWRGVAQHQCLCVRA